MAFGQAAAAEADAIAGDITAGDPDVDVIRAGPAWEAADPVPAWEAADPVPAWEVEDQGVEADLVEAVVAEVEVAVAKIKSVSQFLIGGGQGVSIPVNASSFLKKAFSLRLRQHLRKIPLVDHVFVDDITHGAADVFFVCP